MARMTPGLELKVDNKLGGDDSQIGVQLAFNSIEDFEPARVAEQVPALKSLLETRAKLRDLMGKADRSGDLERLLEQIVRNQDDELKALAGRLGLEGPRDNPRDAPRPEEG